MRIHIISFLFFIISSIAIQTSVEKEILGKWQFVQASEIMQKDGQEVSKNIEVKNLDDPFIKKDVILSFQADNSIVFKIGDFIMYAKYTIKDSVLTIGKYKYGILKVTEDRLLLKTTTDSSQRIFQYKKRNL